jgi:NADH:ubiquinone oxidoreductase subunit D
MQAERVSWIRVCMCVCVSICLRASGVQYDVNTVPFYSASSN